MAPGGWGARPQVHSRKTEAGRAVWLTHRLWKLVEGMPAERVPISSIGEFDKDCWFDGGAATCRAVAEHARRIVDADLSYPIILAADGHLMDGGHRVAKAWMLGHTDIAAVRFAADPPPDVILKD